MEAEKFSARSPYTEELDLTPTEIKEIDKVLDDLKEKSNELNDVTKILIKKTNNENGVDPEEDKDTFFGRLAKRRRETKIVNELLRKWSDLMALKNVYNRLENTFTVSNIKIRPYGIDATIFGETGLPVTKLEDYIEEIEGEFNCRFRIHADNPRKDKCDVTFLNIDLEYNKTPFKPYKVKPYELYWGLDEQGLPIVTNVNKAPHTLVAGQTGKGKNGALDHALMSLVANTNPKDAHLILLEGSKSDLVKYAFSPHTQAYVTDYIEMAKIMGWVCGELAKRVKLLMPMVASMAGDNLDDYNKTVATKLPYIYIIIDEFLGLMVTGTKKTDPISKAKEAILDALYSIAQTGRSFGIIFIACHQKPEKALMPTFLKNMSANRICFGFDDKICSQIVLGNDNAHKLPQRCAIVSTDGYPERMLFTTDLRASAKDIIFKTRIKKYNPPLQSKVLGKKSFENTVGIVAYNSGGMDYIGSKNKKESASTTKEYVESVQEIEKEKEDNLTVIKTNNSTTYAREDSSFTMTTISREEAKRYIELLKLRKSNKGIKTSINNDGIVKDDINLSDLF